MSSSGLVIDPDGKTYDFFSVFESLEIRMTECKK